MKKFTQKLAAYSAAAGAMLTIGQTANAQVVYTDVDPDESFTAGSYNLDLNNDVITDFILEQNSWYAGWQTVRILPQAGAGFLSTQYPPASGWGTYTFAQLLADGDPIDGSGTFNASSTNATMSLGFVGSIIGGPWAGQTEQFLGLRFTLDGGTTYNYGWARVSVNADATQFTIHDYAYESTPDVAINAGDGVSSLPSLSGISVANIMSDAADLLFTPSVDGDAYYVLLLEADAAPTDAEVVAGTGSGGATAVAAGNMAVTGGSEATINLTGLTEGTTYSAYLVLDDGVVKTLSVVYDVDFSTSVGINSLTEKDINIFPNPSNGIFNIDTNLSNFEISVIDITGKTIIHKIVNNTLDISSYGSGTYFVQIKTDEAVINKRIIIK